ncbi:hypothetical protein IGL64_000291 [Enterococcus sp. MSG3285]|nr:hypothetical protein EA96_01072 [Enterococcus faecalis]
MANIAEEYKRKTLIRNLHELEFYERLIELFGSDEVISKSEVELSRDFLKSELKETLTDPPT